MAVRAIPDNEGEPEGAEKGGNSAPQPRRGSRGHHQSLNILKIRHFEVSFHLRYFSGLFTFFRGLQ